MIKAKPIIADQYWILRDNDRKVGNIQAGPNGYSVQIDDRVSTFKSLSLVKKQANIVFDTIVNHKQNNNNVYGYDPNGRAYNAIFDVHRQLPLFTKTRKSKSWFAAGWYSVCQHGVWITMENPKLITLQRYEYKGPFNTEPK